MHSLNAKCIHAGAGCYICKTGNTILTRRNTLLKKISTLSQYCMHDQRPK
jgi:hypothetical protein